MDAIFALLAIYLTFTYSTFIMCILLVASVILMVNIEVYYHIAAQPMNVTQIQEAHVLAHSSSRILILHIHGTGGQWELLPGVPWAKRTMLDVLMNVLNTSQTFTLERWW